MYLTPKIVSNLELLTRNYQTVFMRRRDLVVVDKEYLVRIDTTEWCEYTKDTWNEDFGNSIQPTRFYTPTNYV